MKYYKIINLNRQQVGPFTASQTWLDNAQTEKDFSQNFSNLGECDAKGNLLKEIATNNFIASAPAEKPTEIIPPSDKKDDVIPSTDESDFQSFDDTNKTTINEGTGKGTDEPAIGKKAAAKKVGKGKPAAGKGK